MQNPVKLNKAATDNLAYCLRLMSSFHEAPDTSSEPVRSTFWLGVEITQKLNQIDHGS